MYCYSYRYDARGGQDRITQDSEAAEGIGGIGTGMSDMISLINRNDQLRCNGYDLFVNTVDDGHCREMYMMTAADIAFWHNRLDEYEALDEAGKCSYDVLAALEQA